VKHTTTARSGPAQGASRPAYIRCESVFPAGGDDIQPDLSDGCHGHAALAARKRLNRLYCRLDAEAEERRRLTAILADQRAAPARRWWPWTRRG